MFHRENSSIYKISRVYRCFHQRSSAVKERNQSFTCGSNRQNAVGNIKGTLYIAYQAVLEVNRNDISSELRKYVNNDIQLSAIIEYMGYDEGVLHEHEGNVFFVNESNWLIARLVNHMTGEIVQDDIILDSGSIADVLNSRDAFFDYIFGTENH